jgi:hypothetical protein
MVFRIAAHTKREDWFEYCGRTRGIRKAIMTGENFGTELFYSRIGGHALTPFLARVWLNAGAKR